MTGRPRQLGAAAGRTSPMGDFVFGAPFTSAPFTAPTRSPYPKNAAARYPGGHPGSFGSPPPAMMAPGTNAAMPGVVGVPTATQAPVAAAPADYVLDQRHSTTAVQPVPPDYIRQWMQTASPDQIRDMFDGYIRDAAMTYPGAYIRTLGALPAGLTQEQWAKLTPAQQDTFIKADAAQQQQMANAVASGVSTTINGVFSAIKTQQENDNLEAERENRLQIERIRQQAETERERIRAQSGYSSLPNQTTGMKGDTPVSSPPQQTGGSNTGLLLAAAAIGIGALLFMGKGT